MEYREVAYGTTGDTISTNVHYFDSPGGTDLGKLKGESYRIIAQAVLASGEKWYGIDAKDDLIRWVRAIGLKDIRVVGVDYNAVVDAMVVDIFAKVTTMMETNTDGR